MARKTVSDAVAKWQQRIGQSGDYYKKGVQNTTKSWAANSVAAAARRNAGLQAAIADGRIDAGIHRVGDGKWKTNTVTKGYQNWVTNTPKAAPAYQAGMQKVYNYFSAADGAVAGIDTSTVAGRIQKAATFLQSVHDQAEAAKAQNG